MWPELATIDEGTMEHCFISKDVEMEGNTRFTHNSLLITLESVFPCARWYASQLQVKFVSSKRIGTREPRTVRSNAA